MSGSSPVSTPPTFGMAISGSRPWGIVRDTAERLERVDRIDTLWVLDERFHRDAWVTLGGLAATTRRVAIGTCVTDAFVRHPALTGTAAATLAEASGGRAILGLGAGVSGFAAMGIERRAPATALREAIDLVRRLWASETAFELVGETVVFRGARLGFGPVAPVPIMIAGRGPRILRLAGEVADQALVATFVDGPLLEHALARLEEGLARRPADRPPLLRSSWVYVSTDDDRGAARDAVRAGIATALWGSQPILAELGIELPAALRDLMASRPYAHSPEVLDEAARLVPDELIDECAIAGTPEDCRRGLARLAGHGFRHIAIWPFAPAGRTVEDVITRLAEDVIPWVGEVHPAEPQRQRRDPDCHAT